MREVVADTLRAGLEHSGGRGGLARPRMKLPLVHCAHEAAPGDEVTPERVAEILVAQDANFLEGPAA